jgi:hypothetical protein
MGRFFTSGEWTVKEGHNEHDFIEAWLGTANPDPPVEGVQRGPILLRDLDRPGRFLSFAEFETREPIDAFRSRPDFPQMIGRSSSS